MASGRIPSIGRTSGEIGVSADFSGGGLGKGRAAGARVFLALLRAGLTLVEKSRLSENRENKMAGTAAAGFAMRIS